jgi:hypothetical protein
MKRQILTHLMFLIMFSVAAQVEPGAGKWKPWLISSVSDYRLPAPLSNKDEIGDVVAAQKQVDAATLQKIIFWQAGGPGYQWNAMIWKLWPTDVSGNGVLANMLLGTATYDATLVAWDAKYKYNRSRPFADNRVKFYGQKPDSPSYPCENSVAAGVAVAVLSHFYPKLADSVNRMAQQAMASSVASGAAFPSDTKAGFELGKKIAEKEIELTRDFITKEPWDGKIPPGPGLWSGKMAMFPNARLNKTLLLDSASQLRPGPPPDFAKDMDELRNFKQTFSSRANAFLHASQSPALDLMIRKIFEYNLDQNPPRLARLYAAVNVAYYDTFTACFEAKYHYWGIRPDQYDPSYKPLMQSPPFPGYPSGHASLSGVSGDLLSYFFPMDSKTFKTIAKEGAESRFQAGIHFRTDNEVGLELGRKVAGKMIERLQSDGAGDGLPVSDARQARAKAK